MNVRSPRATVEAMSSAALRALPRGGRAGDRRLGTQCSDTAGVACSRSRDGREMEKGSGKKRRRSAYFVHFGGRLHRTRVDFLAQEGLRLDAGDHEQDPDRVLQVVLDGTAPDDPRLRVDLLAHDLDRARAMGEKWKKVRVKRGGGQRTSSTSADVFTGPV